MPKTVELANERIAESESWWRPPKPAPEFGPNFGLARQADRIEIKVPTQRLDFFPTVAETYMDSRIKWRADGTQTSLKPGTRKRYSSWINNSMDPELGSLAMVPMRNLALDGDIDPHFKRYLATYDADTAQRYRGFLIGIGKYAEDLDIWPKNLFSKLPPVSGSALTTEKRILSLEEIDWLYAAAVDPGFKTEKMRTSALAALRLLRLGLRPAEVFALSMVGRPLSGNRFFFFLEAIDIIGGHL
ncbi:MAG: hypothetical protein P4L46_09330 [Fimbriimonas sp.]|nr:hypothetical protein [Fimbriimonas sp.]